MKIKSKHLKIYAWLFLIVGFLTTSGALLILSKAFLFNKYTMNAMILPAINLFIAGPFSLISGFLLIDKHMRGIILGLVTSGLLIFCSVSYFFQILINENINSMWDLFPHLFGLAFPLALYLM